MADQAITAQSLSEGDWNTLLERIDGGNCTPFIGPGARTGVPDADSFEIARRWALESKYPANGYLDLPKVGRYVSVQHDVMRPKELIVNTFKRLIKTPDFAAQTTIDDPHRVLAELPFPVYITTNYDDFMWQALQKRRDRDPQRDFCRWSNSIPDEPQSPFDPSKQYTVSAANPILFHLYGHTDCLESLVVTDDDYLEFLISVSKDQSAKSNRMIPGRIQRAMTGSSLLLLGYRLDDWDFRVLFHLLLSYPQRARMHVAVQLAPSEGESPDEQQEKLQKHLEVYQAYLASYFQSKQFKVHVSLQTCLDFVVELRERWRNSPYGKK